MPAAGRGQGPAMAVRTRPRQPERAAPATVYGPAHPRGPFPASDPAVGRPGHSGWCSGPPKSGLVKSGLEKLGREPAAGPSSGLLNPGLP